MNDLNKKYSALHTAPIQALYAGFPEDAELPTGAIRVYRQDRQPDFQRPGRGARQPFRQRTRQRNYQNMGGRGRGLQRRQNLQQNIQQVMNLLSSMM